MIGGEIAYRTPCLLRTRTRIKVPTLNADASRLAALLVAYIRPVCALLAPCPAGPSTPRDSALISGRALSAVSSRTLRSRRTAVPRGSVLDAPTALRRAPTAHRLSPTAYSEYGQATSRSLRSSSGGTASAQDARAIGQRVRNGQPDGLFMGDGMSPTSFAWRIRRALGSGRGADASSAREYG